MIEQTINIKPLSVNEAWQGKRFKTPKYKNYETEMLLKLKPAAQPKNPIFLTFEFGFSNKLSDLDNPIKLVLDILQKKYKFNDAEVFELNVKKVLVKKGSEYIKFKIE